MDAEALRTRSLAMRKAQCGEDERAGQEGSRALEGGLMLGL